MKTRDYLVAGNELSDKKQDELALNAYTTGIEIANDDDKSATADCYFYRGDIYFNRKNYPNALENLEKALELSTSENKPECLHALGNIHFLLGNTIKAMDFFNQAVANYFDSPYKANSYIQLGQIYFSMNEQTLAIENYNLAIQIIEKNKTQFPDLNPGNAYLYLGEIYIKQDRLKKALSSLDKAIESFNNPENKASCFTLRGKANFNNGKYKKAINDFKKAITLYNSRDDLKFVNIQKKALCYFNRAKSYAALGNYSEAINDFRQAILTDPSYSTHIAKQFDQHQLRWILRDFPHFYSETILPALAEDKKALQCIVNMEKQIKKENTSQKEGRKLFGLYSWENNRAKHNETVKRIAADLSTPRPH